MKRNEWGSRAVALGLVLGLGGGLTWAQQSRFRRQIDLTDAPAFSQGSQDIRFEGHFPSGEMGAAVAFGDLDGDGRLDVAQAERNSNAVYIFFGRQILDPNDVNPGDPNAAYVVTNNLGVTADRPDVVIFLDPNNNDTTGEFGFSLATGNVNGDTDPNTGLPLQDLLIGAPFDDAAGGDAGRVFVIRGRSRASWPASLNAETGALTFEIRFLPGGGLTGVGNYLGFSVASGDFTGDGLDDIAASSRAAGIPLYSASPTSFYNGAVHLIQGSAGLGDVDLRTSAAVRHIRGSADSDFLGEHLDFCHATGAAQESLLIGAIGVDNASSTDAGAMYVLTGPTLAAIPGGVGNAVSVSIANSRILGRDSEDSLGFSVACADINGDGFDDPTTGAFFASGRLNQVSGGGEVFVFYGASTIPGAAFPATIDLRVLTDAAPPNGIRILPSTAGDQLGFSVAYGNTDCDPNTPLDLIVGARRYDPQRTGGAVAVNAGVAWVIRGSARSPGTQLNMARGTFNPANPTVRPGNFPTARNDGADAITVPPATPSCDPNNVDDPNNPCAVIAVLLGAVAHSQAGFSAAAGDFNGDGCDEIALGALGDLTRIPGYTGRIHAATIADNDRDQVSDLSDNDDDNDCLQDDDESNALMGSAILTDPLQTDTDGDGVQDGTELGKTAGVTRRTVIFAGADCSLINPLAPECCRDADAGGTTTDPNNPDTDADNLQDGAEDSDANGAIAGDTSGFGTWGSGEQFTETNPNNPDTDADGISDDLESLVGCPKALDADSDDDGLPDGCIGGCGNPQNGESLDGDAIVDPGETSFCVVDTDGDGLQDGTERGVNTPRPGPNGQVDTGAGQDGTNTSVFRADQDPASTTNPLDTDTDDDCLPDGCMASLGACPPTDPNLPVRQGEDLDRDGLRDGTVLTGGGGSGASPPVGTETDPVLADSDLDQLRDGLERGVGAPGCAAMSPATSPAGKIDTDPASVTDPRDSDTDDGGIGDGTEDTSSTGSLNGAHDFNPMSFACDPNGNPLLDTKNETDPLDPDDDRGAAFSRAPSPAFADPNNRLLTAYIQNDSLVVILDDTDENSNPSGIDSITLDPSNLVDPSNPALVQGLGCLPDDPNALVNKDTERIVLSEVDPNTGAPAANTGTFRGSVPLSTGPGGAGTLNLCTEDDRVRFGYRDVDDLCDQRVILADVTLTQISATNPAGGSTITSPVTGVRAVFGQDLACSSVTSASFTVTGTMGTAVPDPNGPVTCAADPNQPGFGNRRATLNFPSGLPDDRYAAALECDPNAGITDRKGFPADCETGCVAPPGNAAYCTGFLSGNGTAGGDFLSSFIVDNDSSPSVAAVDPANASVVDPNRPGVDSVVATFSEAMDSATIDPNTFTVAGTMMALIPVVDPNTGRIPYDAVAKKATFESSGGVLPDDRYTVALQDTIRDLATNLLDGDGNGTAGTDFGSTFVIDYDQVPGLSAVSPLNGAVTSNPAVNIVLAFDQAMEESTVENPGNWSVTGTMMSVTALSIVYDPVSKQVTFDPNGSLPDDRYTITLSGATDHAGNVMDGDGNSMAGGAYVATFVVDADTTPSATANSPAAASTAFTPVSTIDVLFSEAMDEATIDPNTFTVQGAITGSVSCDFSSIPYNPVTKLSTCSVVSPSPLPEDVYTVTLRGDPVPSNPSIRDLAQNPLDHDNDPNTAAADFVYTFTVDLAPVVTAMSPAPDANVGTGPLTSIDWSFDQAMDPTRLDAAHVAIAGTSGAKACDGFVITSDPNTLATTLTCTRAAGFPDDLYTVTLDGASGSPMRDAGAFGRALDGNCPGGGDPGRCEAAEVDPNGGTTSGDGTAGGNFVAVFLMDANAPVVSATDPNDGFMSAAEVALVTITFSEAMNASRISGATVEIVDVSDPNNEVVVSGVVSYDPNSLEATFDPDFDIGNGNYEIRVQSSDPNTGTADVAGNLLTGGDFTASFAVQSTATLRLQSVGPAVNEVIHDNDVQGNDLDADFTNNLEDGSVDGTTYFLIDSTSTLGDPNTYEPCTASRRGGSNKDKIDCTGLSTALADDRYTVIIKSDPGDPNLRIYAQGDPANFLDGENPCTVSCTGVISGNGFNGGDFVYSFFIDDDEVPVVTGTFPAAAATVTDPNDADEVRVTFDQRMDPNTFVPGTTVTLVGSHVGAVTLTVSFNPATRVATLTPSTVPLPDDDYTLTLFSNPAGSAVRDHSIVDPNTQPLGNALDGNGNGSAGGNFTLSFTVDVDQVPQVAEMAPPPGATSAAPITSVSVFFDQVMDGATITTGTFTVSGSILGGLSADSLTLDPNTFSVAFNRAAGFPDETYTVILDSDGAALDVRDLEGHRLDGDCPGGVDPNSCEATEIDPNVSAASGNGTAGGNYRAIFVQDADPRPNVTTVTPPKGFTSNTGVTSVVFTFDQIMAAATIQDPNNLSIVGSDPNVSFPCDSGPVATLDPNTKTSILTCARAAGFPDDTYSVTLVGDPNAPAPAADLAGNPLDGDADPNTLGGNFTSTFTVAVPPVVTASAPDPNTPSTDPNAVIVLTFDQDMNASSVENAANWSVSGTAGPVAAGSISYDPNTLAVTFTPSGALPDDTYSVTLEGDPNSATFATDAAGVALDGDGNGSPGGDFTTSFVMDADALPQVVAFAPSLDPNMPSADPNVAIVVTFDQAMSEPSIEDPNHWMLFDTADPNTAIAGTITYDAGGLEATFLPSGPLPDATYRVRLAGATDTAANDLDGRCPGGVCDSPSELPTGDPNQVAVAFVAEFEVDAVPGTPPPVFDPLLEVEAGGVLVWSPAPAPPGGGSPRYNLYRGDLEVLADTGVYTQDPVSVGDAELQCGITGSSFDDGYDPLAGKVVFYLVAEVLDGMEGPLGVDGQGHLRPSEGLCGTGTAGPTPGRGGGSRVARGRPQRTSIDE